MHYRELVKAHQVYYSEYGKGIRYYDEFMSHKDWRSWGNPELSGIEIMKLFGFILSWDSYFQGVADKFQQVYKEIFPIIQGLEKERIEDVSLEDGEIKASIVEVFNKVANCALRYESTDASKILHTILPNLFVMWDRNIRTAKLGDESKKRGEHFVNDFLPLMKKEINEAIDSLTQEKGLPREEAIILLRGLCDWKTLPKLIDEFNWVNTRRKI